MMIPKNETTFLAKQYLFLFLTKSNITTTSQYNFIFAPYLKMKGCFTCNTRLNRLQTLAWVLVLMYSLWYQLTK